MREEEKIEYPGFYKTVDEKEPDLGDLISDYCDYLFPEGDGPGGGCLWAMNPVACFFEYYRNDEERGGELDQLRRLTNAMDERTKNIPLGSHEALMLTAAKEFIDVISDLPTCQEEDYRRNAEYLTKLISDLTRLKNRLNYFTQDSRWALEIRTINGIEYCSKELEKLHKFESNKPLLQNQRKSIKNDSVSVERSRHVFSKWRRIKDRNIGDKYKIRDLVEDIPLIVAGVVGTYFGYLWFGWVGGIIGLIMGSLSMLILSEFIPSIVLIGIMILLVVYYY